MYAIRKFIVTFAGVVSFVLATSWLSVAQATTYTTANVAGQYGVIDFVHIMSPIPQHEAGEGTLTLNSDGTYTATLAMNLENATPQIQAVTVSGTYTVASDGTFALMPSGGGTFTGKVANAGKSIVLAQTTQANNPEIFIATRMDGTYSNANLNGSYASATYSHDQNSAAGTGYYSAERTVSFDGNGNFSTTGTYNSDGAIGPNSSSGTYTVSSTGAVVVTNTSGTQFTGNVTDGGNSIIMAAVASGKPTKIVVVNKTGGTYSNAGIAGSYTVVYYGHGGTSPTSGYVASVPTLTFNSNGTWSSTGTQNLDGNISPNTGSGTYTLKPDGTFVMTGSSGHITTGSFGDSGNSMTGAIVTNGQSPAIFVGYKNTLPANTPPATYTLGIANSGNGTIISSPSGIDCGSTCSATYSSGASVTLTATPSSGSTFAGWSGACTGTGACMVSMNAAQSVTATFNPVPFAAVTTGVTAGIITAPTVTTTISFKAADVGKTGAVFVTAWVPSGSLTPAQQAKIASYTTRQMMPMGATAATTYVLVQLTPSGWQPVVNGQLIPYASGVLGDQLASLTILNNTDTTKLLGAQFCVGYGTSAAEMTAAGRMQLIATAPNPNAAKSNTGSCNVALPISDARVFAYAVSNYASLFAGTATAGQYQQYDYRYYPTYQNYLAVDDLGAVWVMGPVFTPPNKPIRVGPVESFRSVITTWEGAQ